MTPNQEDGPEFRTAKIARTPTVGNLATELLSLTGSSVGLILHIPHDQFYERKIGGIILAVFEDDREIYLKLDVKYRDDQELEGVVTLFPMKYCRELVLKDNSPS